MSGRHTATPRCAVNAGSRSATPAADFARPAIAATVDHTGDHASDPTITVISISTIRAGARASEPRDAEPC